MVVYRSGRRRDDRRPQLRHIGAISAHRQAIVDSETTRSGARASDLGHEAHADARTADGDALSPGAVFAVAR